MIKAVFDTDRHVIEPLEMWRDYVASDVFEAYPVSLLYDNEQARTKRIAEHGEYGDVPLSPQYLIGDELILNHWSEALQLACAHKNDASHQQRLDAMYSETQLLSMDNTAVSRASIFPTFATFIVNHQQLPAHVAQAYAEGYNRWLADYCQADTYRLNGVGMINRHDPTTMVAQLEAIIKLGWRCVILRPEWFAGRMLGHPDYEQFWQACEANQISVALHGGTHLHAPTVGADRFSSHFALHACAHPMEMQMAFLSLLESGVFERYPQLKLAFLEAGASWLPHWLWRLDNICFPEFSSLTREHIKMLPSEYFKRQCWVTIELDEPCLAQAAEAVGHDRLLFATDFPHPDHNDFELTPDSTVCQVFDEIQLADVLYHNATRFFGV